MDSLERNLREAIAEWAKRELDPEMPVFTNEEFIQAGVEKSDEQVLEELRSTLAAEGSCRFAMQWAFTEEGMADEEGIIHELVCGLEDVVRSIHRARQLLRGTEVT